MFIAAMRSLVLDGRRTSFEDLAASGFASFFFESIFIASMYVVVFVAIGTPLLLFDPFDTFESFEICLCNWTSAGASILIASMYVDVFVAIGTSLLLFEPLDTFESFEICLCNRSSEGESILFIASTNNEFFDGIRTSLPLFDPHDPHDAFESFESFEITRWDWAFMS